MDLYIDRISCPVTNLGPGRRIGLWVRGCGRGCPGCISGDLATRGEGSRRTVEEVAGAIVSIAPGFDGLTISGGEPFDQPEALCELCEIIVERTGLDILVYSGYTLEELREGPPAVATFLGLVDVLIDGPYIRELPGTKIWRGSDNQRLHCLSGRAQKYRRFDEAVYEGARELQYELTDDGGLRIVGIPERGFEERFERVARSRGVTVSKRSRSR
ncbi:MAG: 4Fe-4S single cluster domain-containing protein [Candidatus Krumholzibacteria bacterium]|nr:4Fe-4S single cluster domain-containing protein [Candidatus Krumholzibacteria bacterium]